MCFFLVTPCPVVVVQPCMEWIPSKEKKTTNYIDLFRAHIKQYWNVQRVIINLGYGVYTIENKDRYIDYQKFVRIEDQNWEIVEITIRIIFFAWDFYSLFFIYSGRSFQVPSVNHPQLKCQFPPKIPVWPKSLLCKHPQICMAQPPTPPPWHMGSANYANLLFLTDNVKLDGIQSKIKWKTPVLHFKF